MTEMSQAGRPAAAESPAPTAEGAHLLRRGVTPVAIALVLGLGLSAPARADFVAEPARPRLSAAEAAIVGRNASLTRADRTAPWLVYRAVRAIVALPPAAERAGPLDVARPSADPDLDVLMRASPEAAHDLFQLIKKAGSDKQQR